MAKSNTKFNAFINNDKAVLTFSFFLAVFVWLAVVVNVSPETTRVIQDVKVVIDTDVPSQFGLGVFGKSDFTVDVTVKGKKYMISPTTLSSEDIVVTAQTTNVDSAGTRTLQLKAESASGSTDYSISSISQKTIDVYFDTTKTIQMVIEPDVVADGFNIVSDGYTTGAINLSETSVTISGPSTEVNRIEKVVARLSLTEPLSANKSSDAVLYALDDTGSSKFNYLTMNINTVVLTIPVLQVKSVKTTVAFKNAPDEYVLSPLSFTVSPNKDSFKISVDDYDKTTSFSVGTIDFKQLSPDNHVFEFDSKDIAVADSSKTESFRVNVDMDGFTTDYFTFPSAKVTANNPEKKSYKISGLNKSVVVVGTAKNLEGITVDDISVEVDLAAVDITRGQTISIPAVVSVKSSNCWVYGTYTVEVTLQ